MGYDNIFRFQKPADSFGISLPKIGPVAPVTALDIYKRRFKYANPYKAFNNKNIVILPLDNMPCYVPEKNNIVRMPIVTNIFYENNKPNAIEQSAN